jgi:hypothetical protein
MPVAKGIRLTRMGTILGDIVATVIENPGNIVFNRRQSTLVGIAFHSSHAALLCNNSRGKWKHYSKANSS